MDTKSLREGKAGTLICRLFGHKFVGYFDPINTDGEKTWVIRQIDFCTRCGASRLTTNEPQDESLADNSK